MTHEPFIRCICSEPANDGPRLIYADWLEEQGESDRAEFIRIQIEIDRNPCSHYPKGAVRNQIDENSGVDCKICDLRCREHDLLSLFEWEWLRDEFATKIDWSPRKFSECICQDPHDLNFSHKDGYEFCRGFVESIACDWSTCRDHLDAIRTLQPITRVTLTSTPSFVAVSGWREGQWRLMDRTKVVIREIGTTSDSQLRLDLLAAEWPGIDFTLLPRRRESVLIEITGSAGTVVQIEGTIDGSTWIPLVAMSVRTGIAVPPRPFTIPDDAVSIFHVPMIDMTEVRVRNIEQVSEQPHTRIIYGPVYPETMSYPPPYQLPPLSQSEMELNADMYQETRRRIIESFRIPAAILRPAILRPPA